MSNVFGASTPDPTAYTNGTPFAINAAFSSTDGGQLIGLRWYTKAGITGLAARMRIWDSTNSSVVVAEKAITLDTAVGWHVYAWDTPIDLVAGRSYLIGMIWDTGTAGYNAALSATFPITAPGLTITAEGFRDGLGHDSSPSPSGTTNYWLDVEVNASAALDISVGSDQAITIAQVATITGVATGGSGTKTYAWTKTSGPAGTFGSTTSASTTFTPTGGVGTYVLRCTVTDGSGSDFDELTLTVTTAPTTASWSGTTSNPTWTPYGGTVPGVFTDSNTATGVVSGANPTNQVYDDLITTLAVPGPTDDLAVTLPMWREGGTSGTAVARLYEGATLRSTSTSRTLPTTAAGSITVVFPAADLVAISPSSWASGLRVTVTVTAS